MSYINKSVSINGTEKDFIKAFANELTSADSRITCETDIDAEFANEDSSHIITIIFDVSNCYKIKLIRAVAINRATYQYNIQTIINNVDKSSANLYFLGTTKPVTDIATRTFNFMLISNDNAIVMLFSDYNQSLPNAYKYNLMSYHEQDFNVIAYNLNIIASKAEYIRTDENHQGETYKITNRLLYSRDEDVEIIESKPLVQNNIAVHDMKNVYDCSNVLAGNILIIDSNRFFVVDSNTLIKIKE
ncbi:MAG: hypothetical protein ACLS5A_03885 [Pseudoruminococcus massiliensis]|uniref:hypothetical protein n=1 Tax=Pseudoruminococcus massiliensis TaxID=2086583 RepID=UPI0039942F2C